MINQLFSNPFVFVEYNFGSSHHTDNRNGFTHLYLAAMLEGECRIASDEGEICAGAGESFYIPMGLPYQSYWRSRGSVRFLSFAFPYFPDNAGFCLQKFPACAYEEICSIPHRGAPDSAAIGQMYTVLGRLIPQMKTSPLAPADRLVHAATSLMERNPALSIPEIARLCFAGESTLYAAFRKSAGVTPNEVRQQILSERAVQLLTTTSQSVQQISDALGFSSADYLRQVLKKHTGMTPGEIRRSARRP